MDVFDSASEQEQKDTEMALRRHRKANTTFFIVSALECRECGHAIPEARRVASQGCQYCIDCQTLKEKRGTMKEKRETIKEKRETIKEKRETMKHFILRRRYFESGTYSYLYREDGSKVCCFVEREWCNNIPFKSCVMEGNYDLLPHNSPKYGRCYVLVAPTLGVTIYGPSLRTVCLIHIANKPSQLAGCAAPGLDFACLDGEWGVTHSGDAFKALMSELGGEPATLTILKD